MPPGTDLQSLLSTLDYTPSAEHKGTGHVMLRPGRLRPGATECPKDLTRPQVLHWLRAAIINGHVGGGWDAGSYPKFVWSRRNGQVFEARLSNADVGWYHGYPISDAEAPEWLP